MRRRDGISLLPLEQREAHWPSFFYFYCKYSLWIGILCVNLATNLTARINCQALVRALFLSSPFKFPSHLFLNG